MNKEEIKPISPKEKLFPKNIFSKTKDNNERKKVIEKAKEELEEKKNYKPELTLLEKHEFIDASKNDDLEKIKKLLNKGVDINFQDDDGKTALIWSAWYGYTEIAKMLIEQGANIDIKDNHGKTALIWSAEDGNFKIVKMLTDVSESVNVRDDDGKTALMYALEKGKIHCAFILLQNPNINIKDNKSNNILIQNSMGSGCDIVSFLSHVLNINITDKKIRKTSKSSLWKKHIDYVLFLLKSYDIDLNVKAKYGWPVLMHAIGYKRFDCVSFLLQQPIDINARDDSGNTALIYASKYGLDDYISILLDQSNIDINAQNIYGRSALMCASVNKRADIVSLLLQHSNIDVNSQEMHGMTALDIAKQKNNLEIIKLLENAGAK